MKSLEFEMDWPKWWKLLIAVFICKGIFIASIGTPWYGEDEINHFGYIETMARTGKWYAFADNLASVELDVGRQLLNQDGLFESVGQWWMEEELTEYEHITSTHQNATAYQPPLYYWLVSKLVGNHGHIISRLYFYRYLNVIIGGVWLIIIWKLFALWSNYRKHELLLWLAMLSLAWHPLVSFMAASVTVQIWVLLLYVILWWYLGRFVLIRQTWFGVIGMMGVLLAGLLSQQAFLAAPVWLLVVFAILWRGKLFETKIWLVLSGLVVLCCLLVLPNYWQRHQETDYVVQRSEAIITPVSPIQYLPREFVRLKTEMVSGFWDMQRSFIPYQGSATVKRVAGLFLVLSLLGMLIKWQRTKYSGLELEWQEKFWWWSAGILAGLFVLGHASFDFYQLRFGEQQYFKARYLFPLLPVYAWVVSKGWREFWEGQRLHQVMMLGGLCLFIWLQGSALLWLMVNLAQ